MYEIHDYTLFHLYLAIVLSNKKEGRVNNKLFMKTCLKNHFIKHKYCVQHLFSQDRNPEQQLKINYS